MGDWQDGLRHGQGTYFSKANGFKYEGRYEKDMKHGKGKYTYPNGDIYQGQWNEGVRHGKGSYKYKDDGGVYEGEWVDGIKQGFCMVLHCFAWGLHGFAWVCLVLFGLVLFGF